MAGRPPVQTIVADRWRFSYRDPTLMDLIGDVGRHLAHPVTTER